MIPDRHGIGYIPAMHLASLRLLLLIAALLLGQLGAALHGLSHVQEDQDRPHAACELCTAYAALDHAAAAAAPGLPAAGADLAPEARPASGFERAAAPPYRSRAPPVHLA